jgi:hypothetical protein
MFEAEVAQGIALLDKRTPAWRERIDPDRLAIASCEDCVLGQLYGDYFDGREALLGDAPLIDASEWAVAHGFTSESPSEEPALTAAWRRALRSGGAS